MFAPLDPKNPTTSELEHMAGRVPLKTQPTYPAPAWWAKQVNPETHCLTCGEPLSIHGHCWQHPNQPICSGLPAAPIHSSEGRPTTVEYLRLAASLIEDDCKPSSYAEAMVCGLRKLADKKEGAANLLQAAPYRNGQCGICSCISSPQTPNQPK